MDQMTQRQLGTTQLNLSALGLGTVKIGRNADVKYPAHFELPTDQQITDLLLQARSLGINFIDTAPAYGTSEQRLGKLLPSPRADWIISTKVGETYRQARSEFNFSPDHIQNSVKRSLEKLQLDVLDLVLVHSDGLDESITKFGPAFETLQNLKQQGIIRAFGISPKTIKGAELGIQHADAVMLTLNQDDQTMIPAIQRAHKKNVGIIIKKGFASGHFRTTDPDQPAEDPVHSALRFIFRNPGITTVVVGTIDPHHLQDNAAKLNQLLNTTNP